MRYFSFLLLLVTLLLSGCATQANLSLLHPSIQAQNLDNTNFSVYDTKNDRITFYQYYLKEGTLMERSWATRIPFRVSFMDLWVTGLGHDIKRITNNQAETIKEALMLKAQEKGMVELHPGQKDYLLDNTFAQDMSESIKAYEEKMKRYEYNRDLNLLLKQH